LKNGAYAIASYSFKATISIGDVTLPLSGINRKPEAMAENIAFTSQFGRQTVKLENRYWLILDVPDGSLHIGTVTARVSITDKTPQVSLSSTSVAIAISQAAYDSVRPIISDTTSATIVCELLPLDEDAPPSNEILDAVTGAPRILTNGKVDVRNKREKMSDSFSLERHPRTAVGIRPDGSVVLVAIDGRQANLSKGVSLSELANILVSFGATQGLNLDGGGSTVAVARNLVVNSPSDGVQRPVADALLIYGEPLPASAESLTLAGVPMSVQKIGDVFDFKEANKRSSELGIWGTDGKGVFVDQGGHARVQRAGNSKVSLSYPGSDASFVIKAVDPNPPAKPKDRLR
jgi:hypothetical protein